MSDCLANIAYFDIGSKSSGTECGRASGEEGSFHDFWSQSFCKINITKQLIKVLTKNREIPLKPRAKMACTVFSPSVFLLNYPFSLPDSPKEPCWEMQREELRARDGWWADALVPDASFQEFCKAKGWWFLNIFLENLYAKLLISSAIHTSENVVKNVKSCLFLHNGKENDKIHVEYVLM